MTNSPSPRASASSLDGDHLPTPRGTAVRADRLEVGYGLPVSPPIDVTLDIGSALAVVGPNGCGKSTFLRTVVGLLPPVSGEVLVLEGEVDDRHRDFRADVAIELGDDAFFPALTVREHLLLTCYGHGVSDPAQVVDDELGHFGLTERADALPAALSSGQRRRLLLASVFARPRRLMVLDEPEQRLDTAMRGHLTRRLIEERDGGAVLMATHDARLVEEAATAVLVMSESGLRLVDPEAGARIVRDEL
ncbi:ABC transporter ATP-binding protein [Cellulomonas chengniuliangii]|uniref:ABC transporter ATP-binding protein n=1 Tax=Cellulomonas chengniuliangii TaxID=2968084 RepID=A0ABY5KYT3_9CELL|nr:ABC transporter ATP-binding protein [Cellulomonas chengniuliangii]MCC2307558.1 ABC transporter ATP-binding protein [Cellulomonas chengniuliangii]UUI75672.1 ABC transporter ATP-binding protein [Cellulomonas chengniuliangii]